MKAFGELPFPLPGEAHNEIGGDIEIRMARSYGTNKLFILTIAVLSPHFEEDLFAAALQAEMKMRRHTLMPEETNKVFIKAIRLNAGYPQTVVTVQFQHLLKQGGEALPLVLIAAHVDAGEHQFPIPFVQHRLGRAEYLLSAAADGLPPHEGNNAEAAKIVTAILNLHHATGSEKPATVRVVEAICRKGFGVNNLPFEMGIHPAQKCCSYVRCPQQSCDLSVQVHLCGCP